MAPYTYDIATMFSQEKSVLMRYDKAIEFFHLVIFLGE
jgi:hypothetical protein